MILNTLETEIESNYNKTLELATKNNLRVSDIIQTITTEICDKYCKWPERYTDEDEDQDRLYAEHCNNCPLLLL